MYTVHKSLSIYNYIVKYQTTLMIHTLLFNDEILAVVCSKSVPIFMRKRCCDKSFKSICVS